MDWKGEGLWTNEVLKWKVKRWYLQQFYGLFPLNKYRGGMQDDRNVAADGEIKGLFF